MIYFLCFERYSLANKSKEKKIMKVVPFSLKLSDKINKSVVFSIKILLTKPN